MKPKSSNMEYLQDVTVAKSRMESCEEEVFNFKTS